MHCSDCGYKFENYDDNECRLCGSTRKSYSTSEPKGYSQKSGGSGKKKYVIIPVVIVGIIFAMSMAPEQELSLPEIELPEIELPEIELPEVSLPQDDGIYQVSISEIPSFADKGTINSGISKAMMMWENRNPELEFELVEEHGEIQIEWRKFISRDVLGKEAAGYQEGRKLVIELGSYDCRGNWQQYSSSSIADTIAHETGHYLGLGHHTDESHLMYGDNDEFTQIEFDDLGYNIPSPNSEFQNWIAYEKLELRYNELERKYNPNPQTTAGYNQAMQIYNELNEIGTQMNCIADV